MASLEETALSHSDKEVTYLGLEDDDNDDDESTGKPVKNPEYCIKLKDKGKSIESCGRNHTFDGREGVVLEENLIDLIDQKSKDNHIQERPDIG